MQVANAKNDLQEHFQRSTGVVTPNIVYRTRKSGPDHAPDFVSVVTLPDGREYEGEPAASRKAAEKMAAAVALAAINSSSPASAATASPAAPSRTFVSTDRLSSTPDPDFQLLDALVSDPNVSILVDLENASTPASRRLATELISRGLYARVCTFVSLGHPLQAEATDVAVCRTASQANAADVNLILTACEISIDARRRRVADEQVIVVVTGDMAFAPALVDLLNSRYGIANAVHTPTVEACVRWLAARAKKTRVGD